MNIGEIMAKYNKSEKWFGEKNLEGFSLNGGIHIKPIISKSRLIEKL